MAYLYIAGHKGVVDGLSKGGAVTGVVPRLISRYCWNSPYTHISLPHIESHIGNPQEWVTWEAVSEGVVYGKMGTRSFDLYGYPLDRIEVDKAWAWLGARVGSKYDYWGLYGFLWRSDKYQDPTKWMCSELGAGALESIGKGFNWSVIRPHQISPKILLSICDGPLMVGR
uniref:Uncharacterized protein n=1 Tax=viral metagenome TaxID=1070528 RepID=A0A6M3L8N5_9ZZZZ